MVHLCTLPDTSCDSSRIDRCAHLGLFSPGGTGPKYSGAVRAVTTLWLPVFVRRYALNATICTHAEALETGHRCDGRLMADGRARELRPARTRVNY